MMTSRDIVDTGVKNEMPNENFTPIIYLKNGCPFCFKLRLFLLESNLLNQVALIELSAQEGQEIIARQIANQIGKVSFPTGEIAPGQFLADSDALVAHFAELTGANPEQMPTYQAYLGGVFLHLQEHYRDNIGLRKQIEVGQSL